MGNEPLIFGEWVAKRRKALDLTQDELARQIGCSRSTIRKIETGERRPSRQIAGLLADRLGISSEQRPIFIRSARAELSIAQLGSASPAPNAPAERSSTKTNLPSPATPLIGRELEINTLAEILQDPNCRLLTLIGPGGIGKSRLAIAAAGKQSEYFPDGVFYIPMGPLTDPEYIAPAIAGALGFEPRGSSVIDAQVSAYLRDKRLLLVLDNAEHLLSGIGFVTEIIRQDPGVKLLFTSRERLRLQGEWVFDVHGLPFPHTETSQMDHSSAIELFIQCARRASGGDSLSEDDLRAVSRICRLVEGMPLAIELAAAWVPVLTCAEIAQEIERDLGFLAASIRDLPDRHRSIRAVFDHSWELLTEEERQVLSKLSVFRGGFRRNAAEQIAGANLLALSSLTAKSLIKHSPEGRYDIHELIRQYAAQRLSEVPGAATATAERHATYMLSYLASCERDLKGPKQAEAVAELTADLENLRTAWRYAASHHLASALSGAIRAFYWLLEMRSWAQEAMETFRLVVDGLGQPCECPEMTENERLLALGSSLQLLGYFCMRTGRMEGKEYLLRSMDILRNAGSEEALADAERDYGILSYLAGDFKAGEDLIRKALEVYTHHNDWWSVGTCHFHLGNSANIQGHFSQAEALYRAALADTLKIGDPLAYLRVLSFLIMPVFSLGRFEEAERLSEETLELAKVTEDGYSRAQAKRGMGMAAQSKGNPNQALALYRESVEIFNGFEDRWSVARIQNDIGHVLIEMGQLEAAWQAYMQALEVAQVSRVVPHALEALAGLASLLSCQGQVEKAAKISACVLSNPAASPETRLQARATFDMACQNLPAEACVEIEQAALSCPLDTVIDEMLAHQDSSPQWAST